jgi:hypothetical protein
MITNQIAPITNRAPALVAAASDRAFYRFLEFFMSQFTNPNVPAGGGSS